MEGLARWAVLAVLCLSSGAVEAQTSGDVVKIGVLTDMDGNFSNVAGPGAVLAARMAVQDYGGKAAGKRVEVVVANHQNKPDLASALARSWYDNDGVDLILEAIGSSIGLAVQEIARDRKKLLIVHGVSTLKFTGEACSETGVLWLYSSYSNAKALGTGAVETGGKLWHFLTLDTEGGAAVQSALEPFVTAAGGKVTGTSRFPLATTDFSSYLLQAQTGNVDIIAVASAGATVTTILKQAGEFQITGRGAKFLLPFTYVSDIHEVGLRAAQGTIIVEPFYWNMNPESRAFARRFYAELKGMPNSVQAGVYTAVLHYLRAIEHIGSDDGPRVAAAMRAMPINDFMTRNGRIRPDGDVDRERFVFEVKKPEESKEPFDYLKLVKAFAPGETTRPLSQSPCPLLKGGG